eukprot:760415-Hanusia_phi.AAC.4
MPHAREYSETPKPRRSLDALLQICNLIQRCGKDGRWASCHFSYEVFVLLLPVLMSRPLLLQATPLYDGIFGFLQDTYQQGGAIIVAMLTSGEVGGSGCGLLTRRSARVPLPRRSQHRLGLGEPLTEPVAFFSDERNLPVF